MFEVNDIVTLEGWTFSPEALENNNNTFKVIEVTKGTLFEENGFTFIAEGIVDGCRQMFSTITIDSSEISVVKIGSANNPH